jgi:hypothetical protein
VISQEFEKQVENSAYVDVLQFGSKFLLGVLPKTHFWGRERCSWMQFRPHAQAKDGQVVALLAKYARHVGLGISDETTRRCGH